MSFLRNPATLLAINLATLFGIAGSTYNLRSHMIELSEDHEARMEKLGANAESLQDELEGTLRGHIGLIEDTLDRLEGKPSQNKMLDRSDCHPALDQYYGKRARDEKESSRR
ncbi:histone acetyltransferase subunit protein [Rutstroemia sp. NJR-2017a BVV2]|nr:histone acetyltransferase subunit protein [Rutstroemia sp. NJR-2017a BVV2]PQE21882.1 histone acetyltransferase subunit protein [Rutstroemia sp. NJR-2017a BVV2]